MSSHFYNACTVLYGLSLISFIAHLGLNRAFIRRLGTLLAALGLILQALGMSFRWVEAGFVEVKAYELSTGITLKGLDYWVVLTQHPPWSNLYEIIVYMSFGLVLVFLVCEVKWHIPFLGVGALSLALVALGIASLVDGTIKPLVPALKSWWIMIHVLSASIAYSAGTLAAILSLLYLLQAKTQTLLSRVFMGMSLLNAFILFLLGRGISLFILGEYRVKLDQYVDYPYAGMCFILLMLLNLWVAFWYYQKPQSKKTLFIFSYITHLAAFFSMLLYDVLGPSIRIASHVWDVGLMAIMMLCFSLIILYIALPEAVQSRLPTPQALDYAAHMNIRVSFALVGVVLVTGALWAHYAWGRYWGWDPKETGALLIWMTQALYLHTRITYGWAGPRSAVVGIFLFFIILAGFLGVNLGWFAEGLHSYGSA